MSELKERDPIIVNPLAMGDSLEQVDAVIGRIVGDAIQHIEDEAARAIRQREITRAVDTLFTIYCVLEAHAAKMAANPHLVGVLNVLLDGEEAQIVQQLQVLNPNADLAKLQAVARESIESVRQRFGENPKAKKSKSS